MYTSGLLSSFYINKLLILNYFFFFYHQQLKVYQSDFEQERNAREKQAQQIQQLKQENENLQQKINFNKLQKNRNTHANNNTGRAGISPGQGIQSAFGLSSNNTGHQRRTANIENPVQTHPGTFEPKPESIVAHKACPICNKRFPDQETLEVHCATCGV